MRTTDAKRILQVGTQGPYIRFLISPTGKNFCPPGMNYRDRDHLKFTEALLEDAESEVFMDSPGRITWELSASLRNVLSKKIRQSIRHL